MDKRKRENKALMPTFENKEESGKNLAEEHSGAGKPATVRVQVKPNRAVTGIGGAGATKRINSELANELASQGLVTIL